LPGALGARKARKPFIVSPRTSFMRKTWRKPDIKKSVYHHVLERPFINCASAIHYTTLFEESESGWLNLRPPTIIVSNPVDMQEFQTLPQRGIFRDVYLIPQNSLIVLYLGRVEHRKGIDLTIQAFAEIAYKIPNVFLVIAGPSEDNYQDNLLKLIADKNLSDKVIFTGYLNREQRLCALADADVFVLSSHSENFGVSVVEAMASGLPVVVSDQVGVADDIKTYRAGLVVPLCVPGIAGALNQLLDNEALRKSIGARASEFAKQEYETLSIGKKMADQFKNILDFYSVGCS
jgi:glycosyltransferase involved in cell wall biosynthesis